MTILSRFFTNDAGATAVEYAVILATLFVVVALSFETVGQATLALFDQLVDAFSTL